jgi:hypothetical protein
MNPSLAMLPCAFDAGKLYSVLPDTGAGDFTVSRNGTATYLGADGLLKTAQANEPRLEFNTDGSFRGVLVEPSATNLLQRSEEFENSYWTKGNLSTIVANSISSPNGNITADRHICANNTAAFAIVVTPSPTLSLNTVHTFSIFVKKDQVTFCQLRAGGFAGNCFCNFNFDLGTKGTPTNCTSEIQNFGNNWFRCSITYTTNTDRLLVALNMVTSLTATLAQSYTGNGVDGYYIWGAQLETGSVATSYIPTVATSITRPADIITVQEPVGISEIKTTLNGTESTITPTGGTYQLPNGRVSRVLML